MSDLEIPGPLPKRDDNYVTADPFPWKRFDGMRAKHTGVNLYGSGYLFEPRDLEKSAEEFSWKLNMTEPCAVPYAENGKPNDPEKWTGNWTNSTSPGVARELCAGCHVIEQCLAYALVNDERDFIWGGTTPDERKEMQNGPRRQRTEERNNGVDENPESSGQAEKDRG